MNKDLFSGNKIIYQKMQKKERRRQLSRLQQIRNRQNSFQPVDPSFFRQTSIPSQSEKIIEIERNNIVLFNRIASIIKERPKLDIPKSRSFVKSLDQALFMQEKKKQELKMKNMIYSRRISQQQATIKNDLILKDRMKNQKYMKIIGRYPFNPYRRTKTEFQLEQEIQQQNSQIFHKTTLDFDIKIIKQVQANVYVFIISNLIDHKQHRIVLDVETFKRQFTQSKFNYENLIKNLRMEKNGSMRYKEIVSPPKDIV